MPVACPPQLKACVPYLQRHEELAKRDPAVAYYCKAYAAQVGIASLKSGDQEANLFLTTLMDGLEQEKAAVAHLSQDEGRALVTNCALLIFSNAEEKERRGIGDKITASLFFMASVLMEILKQFGDLEPAIAEKQTWAKWKAAQIKKCLDQGIPYTPDTDQPQATGPPPPPQAPSAAPAPPSFQQQPPYPPPSSQPQIPYNYAPPVGYNHDPNSAAFIPPSNYPPPPNQPPQYYSAPPSNTFSPSAAANGAPAGFQPPLLTVLEAQKYAKWVVSALQFQDVPTAVTNLQLALDLLQGRRDPTAPRPMSPTHP